MTLLACVSMTANAINITINVDDPSRVSLIVNYGSPMEGIVAGDNTITLNEYESVQIKAKDNAFITKVVRSMEGADDSEEYVSNMSECSLYISSSYEGAKWTVTSANADDVRDGHCRIYVDDPSNVQVQRSGTYSYVTLAEGWNDVRYITSSELPLTIGPKNYGSSLYQVKLNGEQVSPQGSAWRISPANGDNVEILANFPDDLYFPVRFTYANEESKGFITMVTVNGENVTNYNDEDFTVKAGSSMVISGNTSDYNLNSFTVNGSSAYFYGQYNFIVTEETSISVDAKKFGTVKATLNVDNADNVIVYKGYSYNNNILSLTSGDNNIELSETSTLLQIMPASGCYITSVTADGSSYSADYSGAYNITVTEGMQITIRSGAIERNSKAIVYIDSKEAASTYFNFQRSDRSSIDLTTGYNEICFYEGDNPFGLSWYGAPYANVYNNGNYIKPLYEGSTTYELNLTDGAVVKIFLASNPENYEVNMTADAGLDAGKVSVTMDHIQKLAAWAGKHNVLQDTELSIAPEDGYAIKVSVNGTDIDAAMDGTFTVKVNANTAISISKDLNTGIIGTTAESRSDAAVYNMQGMRVSGKADMSGLPAGVYVVNGRKVVKR